MNEAARTSDTRSRMLEHALELIQTRGYNAFSYRDLEEKVGIRTASMHYHFPTKEELVQEVMRQYRQDFQAALEEIRVRHSRASQRLGAYVGLFAQTLQKDRLCACGMLATELITLPTGVRLEVRRFFADNEAWLAEIIEEGQKAGELVPHHTPDLAARTLFAALEGAMIAGRALEDSQRLTDTGNQLVNSLLAPTDSRG
jgi:TetR/AcrR family transcriptional repressor of nem operon